MALYQLCIPPAQTILHEAASHMSAINNQISVDFERRLWTSPQFPSWSCPQVEVAMAGQYLGRPEDA
jgi:hypothetical protein